MVRLVLVLLLIGSKTGTGFSSWSLNVAIICRRVITFNSHLKTARIMFSVFMMALGAWLIFRMIIILLVQMFLFWWSTVQYIWKIIFPLIVFFTNYLFFVVGYLAAIMMIIIILHLVLSSGCCHANIHPKGVSHSK